MRNSDKLFLVIGSVAVIGAAAIGGGMLFFGGDDTTSAAPTVQQTSSGTSTPSTSNTADTTTDTSTSGSYKDGSYSATMSYTVPHGQQNSIDTTVTVSDGKITAVSVNDTTNDRESEMYIASFENSLDSDAVGQSLASYSPNRIGGASLTTYAFTQALDTIRSDAQA